MASEQHGEHAPDPPHPTSTRPARTRPFSTITIAGVLAFSLILVAFHFIQPELDPLERYGSEYAIGRMGWLMNLAFLALTAAIAGLAMALRRGLDSPARSRAGVVLLWISLPGVLGSGLFDADPQGLAMTWHGIAHALAGLLFFFCLMPAMILLSRRLGRSDRLRAGYRALPALAWVVPVLFVAMLFVFEPRGLVGLGQRIFLASTVAWLLLAAQGLRAGAFEGPG